MADRDWVTGWDDLPPWAPDVFTEKQLTIPAVLRWQLCVRMLHCRPSVQHVGLVLSTYMSAAELEARPSVSKLAHDTGRKLTTVRQSLAELEARGWLTITRKRNPATGQHFTNLYRGARPEALEVERHADGVRPMRLHQLGECCDGGWVPKGTGVGAEGDPPQGPKGTQVGPEGDPGVGAEGDPEVSIDQPVTQPLKNPDSGARLTATPPPGSSAFENGRHWAALLADGQVTEDDALARARYFGDREQEFIDGLRSEREAAA